MTYSETVRELKKTPKDYDILSRLFFPSFLEIKGVEQNKLLEREEDIAQLLSLLEKKLAGNLTREQKSAIMDYIEQLQLTKEFLEEKRNPKLRAARLKAAHHLAKKMQSAFSD